MPWYRLLGVPLLLVISLTNLASHQLEQSHRRRVLADGAQASATLREPSGLEWVTVHWLDAHGHLRTGTAWTGKPFARLFREGKAPQQPVDIKYVDDPAVDPVVLAEAAERERVIQWWINADAGMALAMTILLTGGALSYLWFRYAPRREA